MNFLSNLPVSGQVAADNRGLGVCQPVRVFILALVFLLLFLAACDDERFIPSPTAPLSGPTLEPTAVFIPQQVTDVPQDSQFIGQNDPTAAALAPDSALPPLALSGSSTVADMQTVEVTAGDGTQLLGQLYITPGERLPGVVLLAPEGMSWGDFPARLHTAGFTVLSMSPRQFAHVEDFRVMLLSLSSGMAQPDNLAAIGVDLGGDMVLLGCAAEPLCDAAVLLSPSDDAALPSAMSAYNPRPIFLTASTEDAPSFDAITAIHAAATGQVFFQPFDSAGHGTALLLNRPDLGDLIIQWLRQQIG